MGALAARLKRRPYAICLLGAATVLGGVAGGGAAGVAAPSAVAAQPAFTRTWVQVLPDQGHPVGLSSPNVATLDGTRAVVVGDRAGYVYAFSLAGGHEVPGWPASTRGIPVDSTPSVAALGASSPEDTLFVGVGNASTPHEGGYEAFNSNGTVRWSVAVKNPSNDAAAGATSAVRASLAVGALQSGSQDVIAPSVGQEEYALNASSGATLPGFPWFTADSGFATPALADLWGTGQLDIVEGGDQTAGLSYGVTYTRGGHLRVISPTGTAGTQSPTGGLQCEYNPDQGVESSPAVGRFLRSGAVGIVVGTSSAFAGVADSDQVLAFTPQCGLAWQARLDGATESSPAIADLQGNGTLDVVEGTDRGLGNGSVYALDGASGKVLWRQPVGQVIGSVVTVDFGRGPQDVVVPTTSGAFILDGADGHVIATLEQGVGLQSSPLVTSDPGGAIGITIAGYNGHNQGEIEHFELAGSSSSSVSSAGAWPVFHHDPQLTGDAGTPPAAAHGPFQTMAHGTPSTPACGAPALGPNGYYEVGIQGAVYAYGNLARCGSANVPPMSPAIVGIASAPDGGGYWLVDRTGRVRAFGDAKLYGQAAGGRPDNVVAVVSTPDGKGYWLAGRSGSVSAFGDARLFPAVPNGRGGPSSGTAPVVGMAATRDGHGYWLVSSSGAVAGFGDAHAFPAQAGAHMSGVIGIAADHATGGYWLADARGDVYASGAPYLGSVPAVAKETAISGIQASAGAPGYRLVDGGGALFCFGTATALGSAASSHPPRAVVAISGS